MANIADEKIDSVIENNQDDFLNSEKSSIIFRIDAIDKSLDLVYDKILASILNKDINNISANDYVGDKLEYIEYLAQDDAVQRKITSANISYAKEKQKIKESIIKLLKFKATVYDSNVKLINELNQDIINRKKEKCRLNLQIIEDEQEINSLTNHLAYCEDELNKSDLESPEIAKLQLKIDGDKALLHAKLENLGLTDGDISKETMDGIDAEDQKELRELYSSITELETQLNVARASHSSVLQQKNKSIDDCKSALKEKTDRLVDNKLKLGGLDIENKGEKLLQLQGINSKLFQNFETDIAEYQARGIDISPEDFRPIQNTKQTIPNTNVVNMPSQTPSRMGPNTNIPQNGVINNNNVPPQPATYPSSPPYNSAPPPVTISPKQMAQNIKGELLGGSNNDVKKMFKTDKLNNLISSIGIFTRAEKKVLADRLDNLNEELGDKQMLKLRNTVDALSKSGVCGSFDLSSILYRNGRVKDLNKLLPQDLSSLNSFLVDLNNNRDIIDDSQFAFIQDTLLNNVRSKSLAYAIKPKSLREFLRGATSKSPDKQIELQNSKLLNSITNMSEVTQSKVPNVNTFYQNLIGKTRDEIVMPEQSKTVSDKEQSR